MVLIFFSFQEDNGRRPEGQMEPAPSVQRPVPAKEQLQSEAMEEDELEQEAAAAVDGVPDHTKSETASPSPRAQVMTHWLMPPVQFHYI